MYLLTMYIYFYYRDLKDQTEGSFTLGLYSSRDEAKEKAKEITEDIFNNAKHGGVQSISKYSEHEEYEGRYYFIEWMKESNVSSEMDCDVKFIITDMSYFPNFEVEEYAIRFAIEEYKL